MPLVSVPGHAMGTARAMTFLLDSDTCVFGAIKAELRAGGSLPQTSYGMR